MQSYADSVSWFIAKIRHYFYSWFLQYAQTTCESSNEWLLNSQPYDQPGNVLLLTLTVVKIVSVNVQRWRKFMKCYTTTADVANYKMSEGRSWNTSQCHLRAALRAYKHIVSVQIQCVRFTGLNDCQNIFAFHCRMEVGNGGIVASFPSKTAAHILLGRN